MLNTNQKPPIPAKPKNVHKTNYVVVPAEHSTQGNFRATPTRSIGGRNVNFEINMEQLQPQRVASQYASPNRHPASDCIMPSRNGNHSNNNNNNNNGTYTNNATEEIGSRSRHTNDGHKNFHTPSHSFDSSGSSSSGGFKDSDFVAKTKAMYEMYDKEDRVAQSDSDNTHHVMIGHSKVQEIQSKLFAQKQQQQQQQQQQQVNNEHSITINRQQIQKSSRELEKLLGMRLEKEGGAHKVPITHNQEKPVRGLSKDETDDIVGMTGQLGINISRQIQQKLQQEMKQQCEIIKEKYLIEKVAVQQHYRDYVVDMVF
jgi:hypothetical protein